MGISQTLSAARARFKWCGMEQDVKNWCERCAICQQSNHLHHMNKAPLHQYPVGGRFPKTEDNNRYILVIGEYFSKWTESIPLPDITAKTVAHAFVEQFICRYGMPVEIVTDQGRQFEAELFKELCTYLEIDKKRTSPWHPQTNGMVERFNRTIFNMLKYILPNQ